MVGGGVSRLCLFPDISTLIPSGSGKKGGVTGMFSDPLISLDCEVLFSLGEEKF